MKRLFFLSLAVVLVSACNTFDFIEPNSNHLDRCRALADANDVDGAIAECNSADPDKVDGVVQTELGDLYLRKSGVTLVNLSDIFFKKDQGTQIIRALAESILSTKNGAITAEDKTNAANAVIAFSKAGNDFYSTLARLSHISVLIAFTDRDGRGLPGEGDKLISKADICNAAACATVCVENAANSACDGMLKEDATIIYDELIAISSFIASITNNKDGLADKMTAVNTFLNTTIPNPADGGATTTTVGAVAGATTSDAARRVVYEMAR